MRHRVAGGVTEYAIHDVYFDHEDRPTSWTAQARSPRLGSPAALKGWIAAQLAAPDQGVVCGDLGYEHHHADFQLWLTHLDEPVLDYATS
jgi:hypothetical protein